MKCKRVVILGATGSIGESALKVARDIPERMEIVGLAAKSNAQKLAAAANEVRPESVCLVDETQIGVLRKALDYEPRGFSGAARLPLTVRPPQHERGVGGRCSCRGPGG